MNKFWFWFVFTWWRTWLGILDEDRISPHIPWVTQTNSLSLFRSQHSLHFLTFHIASMKHVLLFTNARRSQNNVVEQCFVEQMPGANDAPWQWPRWRLCGSRSVSCSHMGGVGSGQSAEKAGQCEGRRLRDYPIPVPSWAGPASSLRDLLSMLNEVNWRVATNFTTSTVNRPEFHGRRTMPWVASMLRKDVKV